MLVLRKVHELLLKDTKMDVRWENFCIRDDTGNVMIRSEKDMLAPIISATFECEDAEWILTAGNQIGNAAWQSYCAAAQFSYGNGNVILCQLDMEHKEKNPVFVRFWNRIFET